jgi:ABC-type amino acid transport substrate-binding protein
VIRWFGSALLMCLAACVGPHDMRRPVDPGPRTPSPSRLTHANGPGPAPLLVASDLDNEPFAFLDENGQPAGRDVEMMEALAESLGRPITWHRSPFETLLPSAQGGFTDIVCATLGITPDRAQRVAFSRSYFDTVITVLVRSGAGEPRGWNDLDGRLVAAGQGTTSERAVREHLPRAVLVLENKNGLGSAERLILGEVDGIAMDGPNADALVAGSGGALDTLHTPLAAEHYALALPRDRRALLSDINAALLELERSGELTRLNGKWGLRPVKLPGAAR